MFSLFVNLGFREGEKRGGSWRNGRYLERKTLYAACPCVCLHLVAINNSSGGQLTASVLFVFDLCGKKWFIATEIKMYPYVIFLTFLKIISPQLE